MRCLIYLVLGLSLFSLATLSGLTFAQQEEPAEEVNSEIDTYVLLLLSSSLIALEIDEDGSTPEPEPEPEPEPGICNVSTEQTPIIKIFPTYPVQAARDGVEGYVCLTLSINVLGSVEDVVVTDASPKRVFDREATRAVRKWKYKPKVENGVPLVVTGVNVKVDFMLTNSTIPYLNF